MRLPVVLCGLAVLALPAVPLPEGPGKKIVETACSSCHSPDVVAGKWLSNKEWQDIVTKMTARGAKLTQGEAHIVVQYLAANFSREVRGRELVLDVCSQCHELDRVKDQAYTKEEWSNVIKGMISEGPPVTDEEFEMIVTYLAANFGPAEEEK